MQGSVDVPAPARQPRRIRHRRLAFGVVLSLMLGGAGAQQMPVPPMHAPGMDGTMAMIDAGATRLGLSGTRAVLDGLDRLDEADDADEPAAPAASIPPKKYSPFLISCRQQFFLQTTNGGDFTTQGDFAGHGYITTHGNTRQRRHQCRGHRSARTRPVFGRGSIGHMDVHVTLFKQLILDPE